MLKLTYRPGLSREMSCGSALTGVSGFPAAASLQTGSSTGFSVQLLCFFFLTPACHAVAQQSVGGTPETCLPRRLVPSKPLAKSEAQQSIGGTPEIFNDTS